MSKEKSPAYQWYPRDILSSQRVVLMDLKTEGAYRRALDFCWLNGNLPKDLKKLCKVIGKGCTLKIAEEISQMFYEEGEFLKHERLDRERVKQTEYSERQRTRVAKRYNHGTTAEPTTVLPTRVNYSSSSSSIKENNIKENAARHSAFGAELAASQIWLESIVMRTKIPQDRIVDLIEEFTIYLTSTGEAHPNLKSYQSHFTHWVSKKPGHGQPSKIQFTL